MPEFRASVIFCSTLSRLLGPGENFFVANCSQDFSTNIFMSFKSKCIMCLEKPHRQKDPAQQKKSSHAELWLFPGEICSGGQVAQSYSITYYNRVHNHVLQHNGEWQQPNHSCFFIWSHLPDKNMSILVTLGKDVLMGAGAVACTATTPQRSWHNFGPPFRGLLGRVWEFAESRDISSKLFACGHPV